MLRPGIVHRLDREVSGVMVAAKHDRAHVGLAGQFSVHSIDRVYEAIVWGVPGAAAGTVDRPLGRHPVDRKRMAIVPRGGKRAVTHWRLLDAAGTRAARAWSSGSRPAAPTRSGSMPRASATRSWATASTAAAATPGCPAAVGELGRILLHARRLGFTHPVTGAAPGLRRAPAAAVRTRFLNSCARSLIWTAAPGWPGTRAASRTVATVFGPGLHRMASLPIVPTEGTGLARYLDEIRRFPMLEQGEEYMLAKSWREHDDVQAAHKLVTSHLRLVAKIAMGYRGYGLPMNEIISEGNVGLMQAVKRFDPDRGFRLATYAMWWIRAAIQEYILHSWSLVKLGTTAAQKKLFFNLRRLKSQMQAIEEGDLSPEAVKQIATTLEVTEQDVIDMNRRLEGPDHSLNASLRSEGDSEWQDWLVDDSASQETVLAEEDELDHRRGLLGAAMHVLNDREKHILTERRLKEEPTTLEDLSAQYGISRERVRQIEVRAFEKLQKAMMGLEAEQAQKAAQAALPPG